MNDKARDECKEPFYDSVRETIVRHSINKVLPTKRHAVTLFLPFFLQITLLSLVFLNAVSYVVIRQYKRKRESEELYTGDDVTMFVLGVRVGKRDFLSLCRRGRNDDVQDLVSCIVRIDARETPT